MNRDYSKLAITTAGGIRIHYNLAGTISRAMALMIDYAAIVSIFVIIQMLVSLLLSFSPGLSISLSIIGYFALTIGYGIFFELRSNGQTPGKRVMELRVIDVKGRQLEPGQIILRNLMRAVDSLPVLYLVGGVTTLFNRNSQRMGDLVANTCVVEIRKPVLNLRSVSLQKRTNSLRKFPLQAARLRQEIDIEQASLILQALERRDKLEEGSRIQLFREMAGDIRERSPFPHEAIVNLSDEQFLRNVLDILYSDRSGT